MKPNKQTRLMDLASERALSKQELLKFKGGDDPDPEIGGWCCLQYTRDPEELICCGKTAIYGVCPPDTADYRYEVTSCYNCQGLTPCGGGEQ
jgi:hypothetical protein